MESPVVVDKPPEYHGKAANSNERGFPFDEEEGSGAWSELAARHPDIAARLRQRPATWARKRRPSSQDATDDFGDSFGGFDRFPFDDIPPEFRDHFPSHWNRRFASRDEPQPQSQGPPPPQSPQQQTTATQTEQNQGHSTQEQQTHLPQYGLRNTVDLGQKSPADPSLVDADDRNHRSMSAPPDNRTANQNCTSKMNSQNHHEQPQQQPPQAEQQSSNVRHIPIFVEGRDEPVINKSVDHGAHFGETKPTYAHSPPQQPHIEREQYFSDDVPVNFHHPPNFSRAFGTPFNKGFRQGPQPFVQQKVYPQTAFARGASPQRSQSPKPQMHPDEHYVKVPVHHDHAAPKTEPSRAQQRQPQQQHSQQQQHPPQQQQPQHQQQQQQQSPQQQQDPPQPKPQQTSTNDPITQILSIQTDVLNLMTEVENFTGTKKDKRYLFLDEMLTRNLIKLDNIETDGKENIRQARKEAIRCIQKCIAVLEAKAEKGTSASQPQDIEMKENSQNEQSVEEKPAVENGEVEMNEAAKEEKVEPQTEPQPARPQPQEEKKEEQKPQEEKKNEAQSQEINKEAVQLQAADTRPEEKTAEQKSDVKQEEQKNQENVEKKKDGPKKGAKNVKKRDKSKENNKETTNKDEKIEDKKSEGKKEQKKVEDKKEKVEDKKEKVEDKKEKVENKKEKAEDKKIEDMQVDEKGDKTDSQTMDVDGASASQ